MRLETQNGEALCMKGNWVNICFFAREFVLCLPSFSWRQMRGHTTGHIHLPRLLRAIYFISKEMIYMVSLQTFHIGLPPCKPSSLIKHVGTPYPQFGFLVWTGLATMVTEGGAVVFSKARTQTVHDRALPGSRLWWTSGLFQRRDRRSNHRQ